MSVLRWPPQAETDSPAVFNCLIPSCLMFIAAFTSRSCVVPHSGQVQDRTPKSIDGGDIPQPEHVLEDGNHRSIWTKCFPCHSDLYASMQTKVLQEAS